MVETKPLGTVEAERMGGVVDVAPGGTALDPHAARGRIDPDAAPAERSITIASSQTAEPAGVVAAAADGERRAALAGEADGRDHVGDVRAASDQSRPAVDHPVVDRARLVVAGVPRLDQLAAEGGTERVGDGAAVFVAMSVSFLEGPVCLLSRDFDAAARAAV